MRDPVVIALFTEDVEAIKSFYGRLVELRLLEHVVTVAVETDDACRVLDQVVLDFAQSSLRPVRLFAQVPMDSLAVDTRRVVVELVPVFQSAFHRRAMRPVDNSALSRCTSAVRSGPVQGQTLGRVIWLGVEVGDFRNCSKRTRLGA